MSDGPSIDRPEELRQMLQVLHSNIVEDVDLNFQKGIDAIVKELEFKHKKQQNGFVEKPSSTKKSGRPKELPPREFVSRNSPITNLWENADLCSVYNCVLAVCLLVYLYIGIYYSLNVKRLKHDLALLAWTFGQFHIATATWFAINLSIVFILFPTFRFWATRRIFVKNKGLYDLVFRTLFAVFLVALLLIPARVVVACDLPPVSSVVVLAEQCRLLMKTYAFVRENIPRALAHKPHQDGSKEDSYPCPKMGNLVYFLFVPTLVYRDNYPRTSRVRWGFVAKNMLQVLWVISILYVAFIIFKIPAFHRAGIEPIPIDRFVVLLALSVFEGAALLFASFYASFHCWPNAFAEMLRFGDRMFYGDWWNCTSYGKFFRCWNMLVYDWLYSYIYRDMYVVLGRNRTGAMLTVFLMSAVVHEYFLAVSLKFFFPLNFFLFTTAGVILVFITRKQTSNFWNFFFWFSVLLGFGPLLVFYTLEWYARINCPGNRDNWQDYVLPRSFRCSLISFPP